MTQDYSHPLCLTIVNWMWPALCHFYVRIQAEREFSAGNIASLMPDGPYMLGPHHDLSKHKCKHVISTDISFTIQVTCPNQKTMRPKYLALIKVGTVDI